MSTTKRTKRHEIRVITLEEDNSGQWHSVCMDVTDGVIYTLLEDGANSPIGGNLIDV
jgi:hypothetical protein